MRDNNKPTEQVKIELLSRWKLEAEFRNMVILVNIVSLVILVKMVILVDLVNLVIVMIPNSETNSSN